MAEKISINRKNTPDDNDLILKQRIKLLTSDYNNSANTIAVIDTNREFVFANNALLDAFQFSLLELKGKKISDLFHSVSSHNDIDKAISQTEKSSWSGEVICYKNDGSTFNSKLEISPIKDNDEIVYGYELNTTNLEGVKLSYSKLFEFLLKLKKSHHSFPDLLILVNEINDIIEFKYFDVESDYFVFKPEHNTKLEDILPKHIVEEIDLAIKKIKSGPQTIYHEFPFIINNNEKIFEAEITRTNNHQFSINLRDITKIKLEKRDLKNTNDNFTMINGNSLDKAGVRILNENVRGDFVKTKDGRLLSLEESYNPVIDEDNRVIGFIAKEKPVNTSKQVEEKFLNSDRKFSSVWEKSFDGLRLTDSGGNIVAVNSAFCKMFEKDEAQLVGKPFTVIYQHDQDDNERKMNKYRNNFESKNYDFQRYTKSVLHNGKSLFLFVNYSYVELTTGESLVLGIFRDISELKKAQDELGRTENLAAIGKMSSYLSHEIKNPIASIKNYVDLLLNNREMPENTRPILNILRDSLGNLSKLLNDVLLFSSNIKLIKIDISIYDLVEKVHELLIHKIRKKNIQFKNNLTRNSIKGDYVSLQSVFFNMIENAIDAVADGGMIELNDSVVGGNYTIHIIDDGCGITEPEKVFEAFHSEKKSGTGLGLAIAKKIIEMHEGNITLIKSKPGGTVFELQFPSYSKG
jgi:PAS domain S-box-containing protein